MAATSLKFICSKFPLAMVSMIAPFGDARLTSNFRSGCWGATAAGFAVDQSASVDAA